MAKKRIDLLRKDECQPLTTAQIADIKSQFHPSNTANVNIVPYHIYDTDEHIVGEWRETIDGVKKKKPVYEKIFTELNATTVKNNGWFVLIKNIQNIDRLVYLGNMKTSESSLGNGYVEPLEYQYSNNTIKSSSIWEGRVIIEATLQYTKTSDTWEEV